MARAVQNALGGTAVRQGGFGGGGQTFGQTFSQGHSSGSFVILSGHG